MLCLLVLVHVALALGGLVLRGLAADQRARLLPLVAGVGALAGGALFLARDGDEVWGTMSMDPGRAAVAGAAVFCAWVLVAATDDGRGRWEIATLVGAGSAGLLAFSLGGWIAPALLFWVCISGAAAVAAVRAEGPAGLTLALIGLSDVLVVGAFFVWAMQEETWELPAALDGWPFYVAVAGAVLRAGAIARLGPWDLATTSSAALIPLLVGSVFALVPTLSAGDEIEVALPLLAAGMLAALWCSIRSPQLVLGSAWLVASMLALVFIRPAALAEAAAAALLTSTVILLWPWAGGRAGPERGLLVAAVPLTVGFGPIVGGAMVSFQRSSGADTVLGGAPWTAFAALLPAALAVAVTMGAAMARRVEPETYRPIAVLATWAVAGVALLLGLSAGAGTELGGSAWLYLIAALIAAGAARFAPRQPVRGDVVVEAPVVGALALPARVTGLVTKVGLGLTGAAVLAALAFTYAGLKTGFL